MTTTPFQLAELLVDDLAARLPSHATMWGVPGHDHRWEDVSPEGQDALADALRGWSDRVRALPPQSGRWDRLAAHVLTDHLALELDALDARDLEQNLRHVASPFQGFAMTFDAMDLTSEAGREAAIARLEGLPAAMEGYRRSLAAGLERGAPVAARQVVSCVQQGRILASQQGALTQVGARCAGGVVGDAWSARLTAAVAAGQGAYAALTDWLERTYLPRAAAVDGVGREAYARALRRFLGSSPDLDETVRWGWDEVRALRARMEAAARRLDPDRPLGEVLHALQTEPAYAAPDADAFVARMVERQDAALRALDGVHFDVPAGIRRLDVRRAPHGSPPGAWYMPPSEDLSRPGAVWYSVPDGPQPMWDEVSTAYHEGFPGHHLQVGLQVALRENLCRVHRVAYGYSGFAEGWALYAEELMGELGYYERPEYELGMLANQMMRACRVVFDVGAHTHQPIPADAPFHPGERWSFELGVELMMDYGGMTRPTAESEVARYLGWPGQAPSYKLGQRVMLDTRREHLARGGTLRDFHSRVLGCGNVGLDQLQGLVLDGTLRS
jgi:uncharacterized protein (DUF885 family)